MFYHITSTEVLDALEIRYGASHGEFMVNEKTGDICLVEVGARLHGGQGTVITSLSTGLGLEELLADVLVGNGWLHNELYENNWRYVQKKFALEVDLRYQGPEVDWEGCVAIDWPLAGMRGGASVLTA